ncbi:MAG: DNA-protecting protein DprA [Ruminococcaceae bacterium]|nr:DNA-protecting protein DprA [Oscillospiraceae bacterium]
MFYSDGEMKDFYYTAVMMNTGVDYKVIRELFERKEIKTHRDLYDMASRPESKIRGMEISSRSEKKISDWMGSKGKVEKACEEYMRIGEQNGIKVISTLDQLYPLNFRVQTGMPKVIYCKGHTELLKQCSHQGAIAVVGSRNASSYALYATDSFSREFSRKGITIISGMALGIDRKAHEAALEGTGSTIAILAGGPDNVYPNENKELYRNIAGRGLIVSEMPPGQQPLRQYFPSRNRLIAGLADCTLVMEAGAVSGTLHTASFAAAQGKEVFVLPNNIYFENAEGGLRLLEDGCCVLFSSDNVIDSVSQAILRRRLEFPDLMDSKEQTGITVNSDSKRDKISLIRLKADKTPDEVTDDEWKTLIEDELTVKPLDIDNLCRILGLPFYRISELLICLQMAGRVVLENGKYALTFR